MNALHFAQACFGLLCISGACVLILLAVQLARDIIEEDRK